MSAVSNPDLNVTRQDLADFYDKIFPYLGGKAAAGFTPVGTIISVMGVNAPANYLKCDGTVYNISDYPELAAYFGQQFSMINKFGGNGTTTFAVPDLRGEFLRGTGTNSHSGEGDGGTVGEHQKGTESPMVYVNASGSAINAINDGAGDSQEARINATKDKSVGTGTTNYYTVATTAKTTTSTVYEAYKVRPTNTSVLFCIATKNIYMNPSLDYSTDEKVVGSWVDGSTIYQKTISCGQVPQAVTSGTRVNKEVAHGVTNIDRVVNLVGSCYMTSSSHPCEPISPVHIAMNNTNTPGLNIRIDATNIIVMNSNTAYNGKTGVYVTIQYTKTTD